MRNSHHPSWDRFPTRLRDESRELPGQDRRQRTIEASNSDGMVLEIGKSRASNVRRGGGMGNWGCAMRVYEGLQRGRMETDGGRGPG